MKKNETCQEDVIRDFAQDNGSGSDPEEDTDEIERYVKAKLVFSNNESLLAWWKKWSINYPQLSMWQDHCMLYQLVQQPVNESLVLVDEF